MSDKKYVLFVYIDRRCWDGKRWKSTSTITAIIASSPQAAHAFYRRLTSRLAGRLLTKREIAYYAHRRKIHVVLLTVATGATNTSIEKALQRAGFPLGKAQPLGEVLPRLPEWLKKGLMNAETWTPRPRVEAAVKKVPPPSTWPFSVNAKYANREVEIYKFKKRVVVYFRRDDVAISVDRTVTPEELFFSSLSLPEKLQNLLLQRREEITEIVPELEPFLGLLQLAR